MNRAFLLCFLCVVLSGCGIFPAKKPRPVAIPALASVSVPLARAKDAVKVARDRLNIGDVSAAKESIALADEKIDESSRALAAKDVEVGNLVSAVSDRDQTILSLKKENHQIAKERDIIPYIVALAMALWFLGLSDALPIAGQYRFYLKAIAFVVGFGAGYGAGRLLVRAIATFLP